MKKLILSIIAVGTAVLLGMAWAANAAPVTQGIGGGTGLSTSTNTQNGNCLQQLTGTPFLTWTIGACGSGSGTGTVTFYANGQLFTTTSTINFQQGTNVTITTSSNGTYTISATGGGSGGLASTTPYVVGNLVIVSSSGALATLSSSTYYLATNPNNYISSSTGNALYYPLSSNPAGYVTSSTAPTSTFAITNPLIVPGNATATIYASPSSSYISNYETIYNIPLDYATNGCFGSSTTTDFGACLNRAYFLGNNASSVQINVPAFIVPSSTFRIGSLQAINGERADIVCVPGEGSELNFGGSATNTVAFTINYGSQSAGVSHAIGEGMNGCNIKLTTSTQTGVLAGGTFGADGTVLTALDISGGGKGLVVATNTYNFTLQSSIIRNNTNNVYIAPGANSGESIRFLNDFIVDAANNNPLKCILIDDFGVSSVDFEGGSIDDCQLYLGQQELFVGLFGVHMENPGPQWGRYDAIYATSSAFSNIYISGGNFVNDSASTSAEYITSGANITLDGVSAYKNNLATTTNKFVNTLPGAFTFTSQGFQNINSAVVNLFSNDNNCTNSQFEIDKNGAFSFCINQDANNLTSFINGNSTQGTLDNNGIWTFHQVVVSTTAQVFGSLTDGQGNKYSTSTSAGSGTVTTSTAVTANNFPFWNSTNGSGLNGTSSLTQVGTTGVNVTGTITVTATSTLGGNITLNGTNQKITSPSTISIIGSGGVFLDNAALTSQLSVNSNGSFTIAPSFSSGTILFDSPHGILERLDTELLTDNRIVQFPDASGIICLTTTCTGGGVATTTPVSSGTIPQFQANGNITNSRLSQSGNTVTIAASTTNIGSATTTFQIFSNGHINSSGTVAQVSSCGTNPSITGTDSWGNVTVGSVSATSCTITFANAYANVPACVVQSKTGTIAIGYTVTTSTIVVTNAALTGDGLAYWCGALE